MKADLSRHDPQLQGFSGVLLSKQDPEFNKSRRVWNGMIDRVPAMIARCRSASDVSIAIRFARDSGLPVSVRGGGHNVAGSAVADGAMMIDLSPMRAVTVNPGARTAEAGGGSLLHDLDTATSVHGLACPAGVYSRTGLGGLALGGGYGWRCRKMGLTCDHIIGAEVVLADGSVVEASENQHPDLLWALRGGGGNFGVVTRFRLRLDGVGPILVHSGVYPGDAAAEALQAYRECVSTLSDDFHLLASLRHSVPNDPIPPGLRSRPVLEFIAVCSGDDPDSRDEVRAIFSAMPACDSTERIVSYLELQALADGSAPDGRHYYTKSGYVSELCDEAIDRLADGAGCNPSRTGSIDIEYLRGAILGTTHAESAFPQREAPFMVSVYGSWDDPALDRDGTAWAKETFDLVRGWELPGSYSNYVSQEEGSEEAAEMYGQAIYSRLAQVKRMYDPDEVFRFTRVVVPERHHAGP
jgi:FAD/FMN-containing dehydrogenase